MDAQNRFESLLDEKAPLSKPAGLYQPCCSRWACLVSGHLPVQADGSLILGCLGTIDVEAGKHAAASGTCESRNASMHLVASTKFLES